MRGLVVLEPKELAFRNYEERALQDSEVLLKTIVTAVSHGTELRRYKGLLPNMQWNEPLRLYLGDKKRSWPINLGYENVARVVAVGSNVTSVRCGAIVWVDQPHQDKSIITEEEAINGLLFEPEDALEYTKLHLERFAFAVRTRVALNAIHDASILVGERVAVIGTGTIGLIAVQLAKMNGASEVYGVDIYPSRLSLVAHYEAIPISGKEDAALNIKRLSSNKGVDVAIDTSGTYQGLQTAIRCCGIGGRVVKVSTYQKQGEALSLGEEWGRNRITMLSSMSVNNCSSRYAPLWDKKRLDDYAIHLLKQSKIDVVPIITHRFKFEQAIDVFHQMDEAPEKYLQVVFHYE